MLSTVGHFERRRGNEAGASEWFALASWRGSPVAMFCLGQCYMRQRNLEAGFRWFKLSSAYNCSSAQHALGEATRLGIHHLVNNLPTPDIAAARVWFEAAAANKCARSIRRLENPPFK